jgi:hypothetical protein
MTGNFQTCYTYLNVNTTGTQNVQSAVLGSWTTTSYATSANPYTYFRILATHIFATVEDQYKEGLYDL